MSLNFLNGTGFFGNQNTNSFSAESQNPQFQQMLQQLAQDATTNPQAAVQLLQSLPEGERHALMHALRSQNPQAAQSIETAFQQPLQTQTSQNNGTGLAAMLALAQGVGKMLSNAGAKPQAAAAAAPTTPPVAGYESFANLTA